MLSSSIDFSDFMYVQNCPFMVLVENCRFCELNLSIKKDVTTLLVLSLPPPNY